MASAGLFLFALPDFLACMAILRDCSQSNVEQEG